MYLPRRLLISLLLGLPAGIYPFIRGDEYDLGGSLCLAHALLRGIEPYHACPMQVGHDPLPAAFILMPLVWLPPAAAGALWNFLTSSILAWFLLKGPVWRMGVFLSVNYVASAFFSQWGALLFAVGLCPNLLPLALGKPHIGIVLGLWRFSWRRALACCIFVFVTLLVYPHWPLLFWEQSLKYMTLDNGFIPLMVFPWTLVLLLKWRDDDARLVLLTMCIPQRHFYNLILFLLIPKSPREMAVSVIFGWIGLVVWVVYGQRVGLLVGSYLPVILIIFVRDICRWFTIKSGQGRSRIPGSAGN